MVYFPEDNLKRKGREFETSVPGANTVGKANTIDLTLYPEKAYLIRQPLSADPDYKGPDWDQEDSWSSQALNQIKGMNSMSVFHDKLTGKTFLGKPGLLELSIIPSIPINYYGLIGKEIRGLYKVPKTNNNSTGGK